VALQRYHRLRTTDVNVKPSALRELPVPRALLESPLELAGLARARAERAGIPSAEAHALDRRIDACVYRAFDLPGRLVQAAEHGFWGERFGQEIQALEQLMSDPSGRVVRREELA
jgi:hypothetical protein